MSKYVQILGSRLLDVAPEPTVLKLFGVPFLLVIAVIVLIAVTLVFIKRARAKNAEAEKNQENSGSSGETE